MSKVDLKCTSKAQEIQKKKKSALLSSEIPPNINYQNQNIISMSKLVSNHDNHPQIKVFSRTDVIHLFYPTTSQSLIQIQTCSA